MRRSNKDILLGLVGTLTDEQCKEVYYVITGIKDRLDLSFDLVKLSSKQYSKLVWMWGKDKTDKCISLLNDWLKAKGEKIAKPLSHYKQIISWVERKYYRLYPADDKSLRFDSKIDTEWKAKKYIQRIPKELRAYDSEVKFLVEKYGIDILLL